MRKQMFFFEKKNQNTFAFWCVPAGKTKPEHRSPLVLFFKKEPLSWDRAN
jgi:hypothetical protein